MSTILPVRPGCDLLAASGLDLFYALALPGNRVVRSGLAHGGGIVRP